MAGWRQKIPKISFTYETGKSGESLNIKWFGDGSTQSRVVTTHLIFWPTLVLTAIGLMMIFSASTIMEISEGINPYIGFRRTLLIAAIGLMGLFITAGWLTPTRLRNLALFAYASSLALQLAILTPLGIEVKGNRNWLLIPGINQVIQPSEFLKLGLAMYLAWVFMSGKVIVSSLRSVMGWVGLPVFFAFFAVMIGHDLGTLLVFVVLVFSAIFVAGIRLLWLGVAAVIGTGAAAFLIGISASRRARVYSFLVGKEADPLGGDLQSIRARWGLGTGGLTGVGPGASRQKWNYLPEAHTDFIFAILGEEFGLIGTSVVILLFCLLGFGMVRLIMHAKRVDACIYAATVAGWILSQALINIGVVIGLLPVIGVPLPLVSSGGSAMLATLFAIGVLLSYARDDAGSPPLSLSRSFPRSSAVVTPGRKRPQGSRVAPTRRSRPTAKKGRS
ncbi:MAG: putative peptidoglycan glycosyltransferase FtsW [Actinomycetaceae bacterium]|nr:putative peptidoglycan glycosyltransferase FtsW [Actinomycetaceae bacterium]